MNKPNEHVMLDSLDGFGFQELCARIYGKLGYKVQEMKKSADEGRDLVLQGSEGIIVIECKHQPNNSIGRPTVQKLHSAVITAGAQQGILITTGWFSQQASEYAHRVGISLIDLEKLALLADQAGMSLIWRQRELHQDIAVTGSNLERLCHRVLKALSSTICSNPTPISDFVTIQPLKLILYPLYVFNGVGA